MDFTEKQKNVMEVIVWFLKKYYELHHRAIAFHTLFHRHRRSISLAFGNTLTPRLLSLKMSDLGLLKSYTCPEGDSYFYPIDCTKTDDDIFNELEELSFEKKSNQAEVRRERNRRYNEKRKKEKRTPAPKHTPGLRADDSDT